MQRTTAKRVVIIAAAVAVLLVLLLAVVHTSGASAAPRGADARRRDGGATTTTTFRRRSTVPSTAPDDRTVDGAATVGSTAAPFVPPVAPGGTAPNGGPLLVPGASDAPASTAADVAHDDNTGTIVALVIAGLLVVALLLALLTYWYWRNTRPAKVPAERPVPTSCRSAGERWLMNSMSTP